MAMIDVVDARPRLIVPVLGRFYRLAEPASYAMLRAAFGIVMVTHGYPKIAGVAHGSMADPMAGSMNLIANVLDLPGAAALAWFVAALEFFGGMMLAAGLLTRIVAPMIAVQMAAICVALGPTWVWIDRGIEFPFLMGMLALFMSFRGGGPLSLDRMLGREL